MIKPPQNPIMPFVRKFRPSLLSALLALVVVPVFLSVAPAKAQTAPTDRITEQFSGQGGRGPYFLSWRGFTAGTEHVYLNGSRLYRGSGYQIDYPTGTLGLLDSTVRPEDTIQVDYLQGEGQPNKADSLTPTISLLDAGSTHLQASYLFAPASNQSGPLAPVSALGLGGDTGGRNWKVSSSFLLATKGGDFNKRAGYHFGGEYGLGALQLTGDFSRAGDALNPNGTAGLQQNQRNSSLGLKFNPSSRFQFSTAYSTQSNFGQPQNDKKTSTQQLTLKPTGGTSLSVQRVKDETGSGDTATSTQTDTVHLEQKLAAKTSATAEYQTVDAGKDRTDTAKLGLDTTLGPIQVQTQLNQQRQGESQQSSTGVQVATKGGTFKFQGEVGQSSDPTLTKDHQQATVEINPIKPVKFEAGLVQAEETNRSETSPSPGVALDQHVGVELTPGKALSVSASLQTSSAPDKSTSDVTSFSAQMRPFSFLQVSGSLKQRSATTGDLANLDTQDAQVALSPLKGLKLTGGYTTNPEDQGQVLQAIRRRLGLETGIGALLLNGGYTFDDQGGGSGSRTTEVGVGLKFSRMTQIHATYRLVDGYGAALGDQSQYGLQFSHDLGDRFSLSLEGEASGARTSSGEAAPTFYKGTAKLGMKF